MKNKILLVGLLVFNFLNGCSNEKKSGFNITSTISFYKDDKKNEQFESNVFTINTRIYVFVGFTIQKNVDDEEIIGFEVQIPYAEYYSTKDFLAGTVEPKESFKTLNEKDGTPYQVKILSGMLFNLDDKEQHSFNYVFEIEANQTCDQAKFIARFKPENTNLNVMVNGSNDNKKEAVYTFVDGGSKDEK